MQQIVPFLWFNNQAEEAVKFYTSVFKDSKIITTSYYGEGGPMPAGTALVVDFELNGMRMNALNGGPAYKFTPAISLYIKCNTQEEIDYYWEKLLSGGGREDQCGWLNDKYGLSWQVAPPLLGELLQDKDKAKANRVMQAMMKMVKIDIQALKDAYDGK
jgi:predicted 3-demethylubiquinone-9 3-methyltransferase (glyoxalase superfamily)